MNQPSLLDWQPPNPYPAKGSTFDEQRDGRRLGKQAQRVFDVLADQQWHTLGEIAARTGDPEASISARIRDCRRFGFVVERQHVKNGLHRYRLMQP